MVRGLTVTMWTTFIAVFMVTKLRLVSLATEEVGFDSFTLTLRGRVQAHGPQQRHCLHSANAGLPRHRMADGS